MLQQLKQEVIQRILTDELLRVNIGHLFKKSGATITRWAKDRDVRLTLPAVLDLIREHEGLSKDEILVEPKEKPEAIAA